MTFYKSKDSYSGRSNEDGEGISISRVNIYSIENKVLPLPPLELRMVP